MMHTIELYFRINREKQSFKEDCGHVEMISAHSGAAPQRPPAGVGGSMVCKVKSRHDAFLSDHLPIHPSWHRERLRP